MEQYNAIVLKEKPKIHWFWSNCIIEAVRAKLRNPKDVRFIMIWPWYNEVWCPHLMWTDGAFEYDFHAYHIPWWGWLWHRGFIRIKAPGWARSYIDARQRLKRRRERRCDQ